MELLVAEALAEKDSSRGQPIDRRRYAAIGAGGGNTGGEHPLRARCSPSQALDFTRAAVDASALRYLTASANFNQCCELLNACDGRRSVPPAKSNDVSEAVNRSTVA